MNIITACWEGRFESPTLNFHPHSAFTDAISVVVQISDLYHIRSLKCDNTLGESGLKITKFSQKMPWLLLRHKKCQFLKSLPLNLNFYTNYAYF